MLCREDWQDFAPRAGETVDEYKERLGHIFSFSKTAVSHQRITNLCKSASILVIVNLKAWCVVQRGLSELCAQGRGDSGQVQEAPGPHLQLQQHCCQPHALLVSTHGLLCREDWQNFAPRAGETVDEYKERLGHILSFSMTAVSHQRITSLRHFVFA